MFTVTVEKMIMKKKDAGNGPFFKKSVREMGGSSGLVVMGGD